MFHVTLRAAICAALTLGSTAAAADSLRFDLGARPRNRATVRPFRIGLGGQFGTVPGPDGDADYEPIVPGELHLGYTLGSHVAVGLGGLAFAGAATVGATRWAVSGGPFVEGFTFLGDRVQPYAQIGVPVQVRFSGDEDAALGVLPYAAFGVRWWLTDFFTLGASTRVSVVASEHFLVQDRVLPQLAVPWTAGLDVDFHF